MTETSGLYDPIADDYAEFANDHADVTTVLGIATQCVFEAIVHYRSPLHNKVICDLGCGEGHLSRRIGAEGATVIGIDLSKRLLEIADQRNTLENVSFVQDDAQCLAMQHDDTFDLVVSNLTLMDIPDLLAVYEAVKRVLKGDGLFVFSITHPCFQAPNSKILTDDTGTAVGRIISNYAIEGFWRSDNPSGIRGKVGAIHRTLSSYLNTLIGSGFVIHQIIEPTLPPSTYPYNFQQVQVQIPSVLAMVAQLPNTQTCLPPYNL